MTAEEEAAYARVFKGGDFYRNVFLQYLEGRKTELRDKLDELVLQDASKTLMSSLSGRRRELADLEEWLETLFKRPLETKGS